MKRNKHDDGGNAFPIPGLPEGDLAQGLLPAKPGMSLEDHFAGIAFREFIGEAIVQHGWDGIPDDKLAQISEQSYRAAGAAIRVRRRIREAKN